NEEFPLVEHRIRVSREPIEGGPRPQRLQLGQESRASHPEVRIGRPSVEDRTDAAGVALCDGAGDIRGESINQGPGSRLTQQFLDERHVTYAELPCAQLECGDSGHPSLMHRLPPELPYQGYHAVVAERLALESRL